MAEASDVHTLPTITQSIHPTIEIKPFRFKKHRSRRRFDRDRSSSPGHHSRCRHHRHHRHSRSSHRTSPSEPNTYDDIYFRNQDLPPDVAFRESLFDALADDEGAAFWEGVYGQPIHTYSPYTASADDDDSDNPVLERMTDEEYVSYVRSKMWEKSHGYIIEERRRREEDRNRKQEREAKNKEEGRRWQAGVEDALKRGEKRRKINRWKGVWEKYLSGWEIALQEESNSTLDKRTVVQRICWPVESGMVSDISKERIEAFFIHAPEAATGTPYARMDLGDILKKERVRWHPDKIQQKAGSAGLDERTMKAVTAVFQIIDKLWSETRPKT